MSEWEVWDSVSGNCVFTGTRNSAIAMLQALHWQGGDGVLEGLNAGPADDSNVWPARALVDHGQKPPAS